MLNPLFAKNIRYTPLVLLKFLLINFKGMKLFDIDIPVSYTSLDWDSMVLYNTDLVNVHLIFPIYI